MRTTASALALAALLAITPPLALAQPAGSDTGTAPSAALPPLDLGDEDIRDIRGPITIAPPWWAVHGPWIAGALAALAATALMVRTLRRRRVPDARAIALAELERAREGIREGAHDRFSDAVSDAVRRYIEARFELEAPTRTTDELLRDLAADDASPLRAHRERLSELLAFCDLARFGGFSLARGEMESMHAIALHFVEVTWAAREAPRDPAALAAVAGGAS